ncbi:iron complex transport system permease protein [Evansella caseinilytica]|uniref:Iron complex transport system permease protein n=1 Tax=Evansella caseinilytica TaxID=1503961 RepID=A0A1H3SC19_9BACI|nr:iron ABC transporter permease [Evansella caseinilytica]SDZ35552.1 iron complex transport system permease protein [Evansella caseinilytica]
MTILTVILKPLSKRREPEGKNREDADPRKKQRWIVLTLAAVLLFLACIYGLVTGSVSISLSEVWSAMIDKENALHAQIVYDLRLPRVLTGLLVGASLAVAGALLQGVMRNPLADPGIVGVSAGAGLVAVVMMILFPAYLYLLPFGAFIGALLAALLIYVLAAAGGSRSPYKIILSGIAVNSLLGAAMTAVMVLYSDRVQAVLPWLAGGLSGRSWPHFSMILPYASIGLLLSAFAVRHANLLLLGDEVAKLLGHHVQRSRLFLIILSAFLAGAAASVAGLIGFVGLVVPHISRMLVGNDYKFLLPVSALGGAFLVVFADTAARSWFDPIELPVGILLSFLGAPFFLYLLHKGGMKVGK